MTTIRVEVVHSPSPRRTECVALRLPPGATVAEALSACGLPQRLGRQAAELPKERVHVHAMRIRVRIKSQ